MQPIPEPLARPHQPEPTCSIGRLKRVAHPVDPISLILMARLLDDPPFCYLSDPCQAQLPSRPDLHIGQEESKHQGQRQGNDIARVVLTL